MSAFGALSPLEQSAQELSVFVDEVLAATGASKVDIVGHSQGTLMPNYYVKFLGGAAKVDKVRVTGAALGWGRLLRRRRDHGPRRSSSG